MNKSEPMQAENVELLKIPLEHYRQILTDSADKDAIISRQALEIQELRQVVKEYQNDHGHQLQRCSICIKADAILSKESK